LTPQQLNKRHLIEKRNRKSKEILEDESFEKYLKVGSDQASAISIKWMLELIKKKTLS